MLTKYCTVEQKKRQCLKTHANTNKKRSKGHGKQQNVLKPMHLCTKTKRKGARTLGSNTRILAPGRPSDKDNGLHAPTQLRLARTHGTHDTHETKTNTKRSGLTPLSLRYIFSYVPVKVLSSEAIISPCVFHPRLPWHPTFVDRLRT